MFNYLLCVVSTCRVDVTPLILGFIFGSCFGLNSSVGQCLLFFVPDFRYVFKYHVRKGRNGQRRDWVECVTVPGCPLGPLDHNHDHRSLNSAELMEFSLQWLLRVITNLFVENTVAECLRLFVTNGRLWLRDALPDGQPLNRMWSDAGYSDLSSRRRHPMHRYRDQRGQPPDVRISAYLLPLVPMGVAEDALIAEYHHLLSDPRLVWNFADLGLYADGTVLPHHGSMYNHLGAVYPQGVRVQFGPLVIDPATYWHEAHQLTLTYPLLPEGPAVVPLLVPEEPIVDDAVSSSNSSASGESVRVPFVHVPLFIFFVFFVFLGGASFF